MRSVCRSALSLQNTSNNTLCALKVLESITVKAVPHTGPDMRVAGLRGGVILYLGESGALRAWGRCVHRSFLGKLLAVYVQENERAFLVWQTIVQRIKLQNVCNCTEENFGYVFCERF